MAHNSVRSGYELFSDRLNMVPQGAPPSDLLFRILKLLLSEREASLLALVPIKRFTVSQAAHAWKLSESEARLVLDELASRAILLDVDDGSGPRYSLPPPMAGFFEFSMMRVRGDIDQKLLAELFYQYLNVEEDFIKSLFAEGETRLGRVFVNEDTIPIQPSLHVLDYERASEVIRNAPIVGVGMCYCRHKMAHMGRACNAPIEICMTFGAVADSLIRHGFAHRVDVAEGLDLLAEAREHGLVQFGENVREDVAFICNCCGCCCEALVAARRFAHLKPVHTTNFIPKLQTDDCLGCGKCVAACPVEALSLVGAQDPHQRLRKKAKLDEGLCLGCGVCINACSHHAISFAPRPQRVITPLDSTHRVVLMALERGKLANLIFDNQASFGHRAMAAIVGVILRLPPIKQVLASEQIRSHYIEALIGRSRRKNATAQAPASN